MNFIPYFTIKKPHNEPISSLAIDPSNTILASASKDRRIILHSLPNLNNPVEDDSNNNHSKILWSYKYHLHGINQIKFNSNGSFLASGGNDLSLNIVDLNKQCLMRNFRNESIITSLDMNSTSNLIVSGSYDNHITLYDIRSRNVIVKIVAHSEPITSVSFSADDTVIITTSYDGFCRVWDVFKFICLKTIVLEKSPALNSCTVLPNEDYLMISSFNSQIEIVDIVTEEEVKKFHGGKHTNYICDCGVYNSNDNNYIVSGDEGGNLCVWDVNGDENNCSTVNVSNGKFMVNSVAVGDVVACAGNDDREFGIYVYREGEEKTDEDAMMVDSEENQSKV